MKLRLQSLKKPGRKVWIGKSDSRVLTPEARAWPGATVVGQLKYKERYTLRSPVIGFRDSIKVPKKFNATPST